jgi:hypothetical protein
MGYEIMSVNRDDVAHDPKLVSQSREHRETRNKEVDLTQVLQVMSTAPGFLVLFLSGAPKLIPFV